MSKKNKNYFNRLNEYTSTNMKTLTRVSLLLYMIAESLTLSVSINPELISGTDYSARFFYFISTYSRYVFIVWFEYISITYFIERVESAMKDGKITIIEAFGIFAALCAALVFTSSIGAIVLLQQGFNSFYGLFDLNPEWTPRLISSTILIWGSFVLGIFSLLFKDTHYSSSEFAVDNKPNEPKKEERKDVIKLSDSEKRNLENADKLIKLIGPHIDSTIRSLLLTSLPNLILQGHNNIKAASYVNLFDKEANKAGIAKAMTHKIINAAGHNNSMYKNYETLFKLPDFDPIKK